MRVMVELANPCEGQWTPDAALCEHWLAATFEHLGRKHDYGVDIQLVDKAESQAQNQRHRNRAAPTNILSFPFDIPGAVTGEMGYIPLGALLVCPELIAGEAAEQGKAEQSHWAHLVIHGGLHLLGYDHQTREQAAAMEEIEIEVLKKLGIPNPYLIG